MRVSTAVSAAAIAGLVAAFTVVVAPAAGAAPTTDTTEYSVLVQDGASRDTAVAAITAAGGRVISENSDVGMLEVTAPTSGFVEKVSTSPAVLGAAHAKPIGRIPQGTPKREEVEKERATTAAAAAPARRPAPAGMDPLDDQLWGLKMIRADVARTRMPGDKRIKVGIIDSGIDGTHPDLAPNFDRADSRNFVTDIPNDPTGAPFDGPCEFAGCVDPVDHDDDGHGTHVAGIVAAAANGFGLSGVAPNVTLVNIRAGQDSGYLFLGPVVNALTYAGRIKVDVVNMSFYVDPWLYNCTANPADTPEQQIEQRTTIAAMTRALNYAHRQGVTLVAALGNNHEDLGHPLPDSSSPDYPAGAAHPRTIDNSTCLNLPTEGPNVIAVSALGPSAGKADYSSYGREQISVAAPGGYFRDGFGTPSYRTNANLILSTMPKNVGLANGTIDPATGEITPAGAAAGVQKYCKGTTCGYYQFLQGTSMASPHVTGVVALIDSRYGKGHLPTAQVERILYDTAAPHACPTPPLQSYVNVGRDATFDALCEGTPAFNGFYGHGIVDAAAAVGIRR